MHQIDWGWNPDSVIIGYVTWEELKHLCACYLSMIYTLLHGHVIKDKKEKTFKKNIPICHEHNSIVLLKNND